MQAPPVPVVHRTGDPIHDRNFDAIQEAFRRLSAGNGATVNQSITFNVASSVVPEGLQQPGVQLVTTVGGIIPLPKSNTLVVTVDGGGAVNGMQINGLKSGTFFRLTFANACQVASRATVGAGQAAFLLGTFPDGSPASIDWLTAPVSGGRIGVVYFASELAASPCLQLVEGPTV